MNGYETYNLTGGVCDICGKKKAGYGHESCSRERQKLYGNSSEKKQKQKTISKKRRDISADYFARLNS